MSLHQGFSAIILIIVLAILAGGDYWISPKNDGDTPNDGNPTSITEDICAYSESGELSCNSDLILVISGKELAYEANTSVKIESNKIIAVGKVDPDGIFIKDSTVLFCPRPGTYEMNEETSRRAVGNCGVVPR